MSHALLKYAAAPGMDPGEICQAAGIPPALLADPQARLPARQFYALWCEVSRRADDPDFGLHFAARSLDQPAGDILSAVMFNCPTVGRALEKLAQYHNLATDVIQVRLHERDGLVGIAWQPGFAGLPIDRQISEAVICRLYFTLQVLSEGRIPALRVEFSHPQPPDTALHRQIFPCPVVFGQPGNAIVVRGEALDQPITLAHPGLLGRLEALAQELLDELYLPDTWSERVSQRISKALLQGEKVSLASLARGLAISTRQLQNKLKDEGATYQQLLDQVRKELALGYLQEPAASLYDVAFLLGYADQSAFNHAFKRWTGKTPGEYR